SPSPGGLPPQSGHPSWPDIAPRLPWPMPTDITQNAPAGLLNLAVPLGPLAGTSATPGQLSWLGVLTASQARQLAVLAAKHPATRWRVVVVNAAGQAIAVTHVPRSRSPGSDNEGIGLIRRVTLVLDTAELANGPPKPLPDLEPALATILDRAIAAAKRAAGSAAERESKDLRAGGCSHDLASPAYRPPPRVAELVTARDGTCRFPPCRRPAEQCDLDHTVPFDQGGLTCPCNIGGECRSHHQLKQHPRWSLRQQAKGVFCWTTPTGRSYISRPDAYAV
ncbi:MAG: HNH endonuclease, partial [Streptosporangiaceae bacterium]